MSVPELLTQIALLGIAIGANALSALAGGGAGLVQLPALILLGILSSSWAGAVTADMLRGPADEATLLIHGETRVGEVTADSTGTISLLPIIAGLCPVG